MFTRRQSSKTRKLCSIGEIRRSAYVREYGTAVKQEGYLARRAGKIIRVYPKTKRIHVKSKCIKNRGAKGKGVKPGSRSIVKNPLRKGELTKFGYHSSYPKEARHDALRKAASHYGPLSLYHKLDAVAKLSIRQAPRASTVFTQDRDWVKHTYPLLKSLEPRTTL